MTERSVSHATFVVERNYDAAPARVFAAWADPAAKARWFVGPDDWQSSNYELDFRVGGQERVSGALAGGSTYSYEARYQDIVPNERIVATYEMHIDDARISVSVATVEIKPAGAGTRLVYTEQGAFLDGLDTPDQRRQGTVQQLDTLAGQLSERANA
jgi:uncharacterized protein YndB with AHSA1/START domain